MPNAKSPIPGISPIIPLHFTLPKYSGFLGPGTLEKIMVALLITHIITSCPITAGNQAISSVSASTPKGYIDLFNFVVF
jgi:hypothetical protein